MSSWLLFATLAVTTALAMPKKPAASSAPKPPAGASAEQPTIGNLLIKINRKLDKYDGVVLFPEKVAKAKEAIARLGLPKRSGKNDDERLSSLTGLGSYIWQDTSTIDDYLEEERQW